MFYEYVRKIIRWSIRHQTVLTAVVGSVIVSIWTVLRHITNGINFDVVGQIGVAAQWIHGLHGGAIFGATNYLIKMPLYIIFNATEFIPPVVRLLLLALVCSVGAFLLIYWLARRVATLYDIHNLGMLNLGMLWLALLSGRVFWVDYANSRNLEVAGGVAIIYLVLRLWQEDLNKWKLGFLAALSSLVFFADPLQMYVVGFGVIIISAVIVIKKSGSLRRRAVLSGGAMAIGVVTAKFLTWFSTVILPVSYLRPPKIDSTISIENATTALQNTVTSTIRIFDINILSKGFDVNSLRQLGGLVLLGLAFYLIIRGKQLRPARPTWLFVWLIVWNYIIYIVSGNALTPMTERYLILVPILFVFIFGLSGDGLPRKKLGRVAIMWLSIVGVSAFLLGGAIVVNWSERYKLDQPMFEVASFAKDNSYDFIITSRGLAVPGNYYSGYEHTIVPTMCVDNTRIVATNLFYDQEGYYGKLGHSGGTVALVLPSDGVVSDPFSCSVQTIINQLGAPLRQFTLPEVGEVYEYSGSNESLRQL